MSEESKNVGAWIVAALLVGTVIYEEARFDRHQAKRTTIPIHQVNSSANPAEISPEINRGSPSYEDSIETAEEPHGMGLTKS